ncbi:MAG: PQQ-binding-like beta-propeller repeat protein [Lentisphaerae bacterium]|nr:PQQ-binding-like beta-propeller repeat protein [Lentisphaerota bacterium]
MRTLGYTALFLLLSGIVVSYVLTRSSENRRVEARDRQRHAVCGLSAAASGTVVFWTADNRLISLASSDGMLGWERVLRSPPLSGVTLCASSDRVFVLAASGITAIETQSGMTAWIDERPDLIAGFLDLQGRRLSYVDAQGTFYSRNASDGNGLAVTRLQFLDPSVIAVSEGALYALASSSLQRVDRATGRASWRVPVASETSSRIGCAQTRLFLVSPDPSTPRQSVISAIAAADGKVLWSSEVPSSGTIDVKAVEGVVCVLTTQDGVFAFDQETGARGWRSSPYRVASPCAVSDQKIVFGTRPSGLVALDARDGSTSWSLGTEGLVSATPVSCGSAVFVGTRHGVVLAVADDGQPLWRFAAGRMAKTPMRGSRETF